MLVLLDVMLPQMDGFTTCQKIRESSEVPIIMVTAMDRDEDKVRGLEIGADHYITKPLSTHELASRVKSVLRRTRGERNKNAPSSTTSTKPDMSFLHQRDETLTFLLRPRLPAQCTSQRALLEASKKDWPTVCLMLPLSQSNTKTMKVMSGWQF